MAIIIKDSASGNMAGVDVNKNLNVNLPVDELLAGFAVQTNESHDGLVGASRLLRNPETSPDYRQRSGLDSILWSDVFNHGQFNSSKYIGVDTTMTKALSGGRLVLNSGNALASGNATRVQTYRSFPLYLSYALYVEFQLLFAQDPVANNVCEFGLGYATAIVTPTDGVFFRLNASGVLQGVINNNSSEVSVILSYVPQQNIIGHYTIVVNNDKCEFWINDILYGTIDTPMAVGSPCLSMNLPLLLREYNSNTTSVAQRMEIANISISLADLNSVRLWATTQSGMGNSAINIPDGVASGQTTNNVNSTAPASATLSNTAGGYLTLGGQWQFVAVAGSDISYALFAYLVPVGTSLVPSKTLMIRGIRIDSMNTVVATATTATVMQWSIGVGSTAVSLATADSATVGTRAPRTLTLGLQSFPVGATVGSVATPIDINLDSPIMVEAGTYVHVILKMPIATATATEIFRGTILINGFFE